MFIEGVPVMRNFSYSISKKDVMMCTMCSIMCCCMPKIEQDRTFLLL